MIRYLRNKRAQLVITNNNKVLDQVDLLNKTQIFKQRSASVMKETKTPNMVYADYTITNKNGNLNQTQDSGKIFESNLIRI